MLTSLSLAIMARERTFSSTIIDLKKKETSRTAPETPVTTPAAPAPATESHTQGDSSSGGH
jgi:preprotein translocase subunit SecG